MLTPSNSATTGTIQHDGIRMDSNSLTDTQMREVLEIPQPEATPEPEPVETPDPETTQEAADTKPVEAPKADTKPVSKQQEKKRERYEAMEARANNAERALQQVRDEAERRHQALLREMDQRLERFTKPDQPKQEPAKAADSDPEPKLEDFADQADPYAAWMRAAGRWEARQEFKTQRKQEQEFYQRQQAERQQYEKHAAEQQRLQAWTGRMEQAFATNPDLRVTIENMPVLPRPMMDVIIDSEIPDQILGHLLQHPEEQQRIAQLHPLRQFREVSRIEYQLEQAATLTGSAVPAKPKTSANPPISPVSGSHAAPRSGEPGPDATYEEHRAYWNQVEAEQRKSRR